MREEPMRSSTTMFAIASCAVLALAGLAEAQDFTGTFVTTVETGAVAVELTVAGDELFGALRAPGVELALEGYIVDGVGVGYASNDKGTLMFEAYLQGDTLGLYVFEMDAAGTPLPETAIELILDRTPAPRPATPAGVGRPPAPRATGAAAPAPSEVLATGAYATLTRDNALAFIEAFEFILGEIGYAYSFTDAERSQMLGAIAESYPAADQMDQLVMAQSREIWKRVRINWHAASEAEQREFALGVLIIALGEEAVRSWVGRDGGGGQALGEGGACTSFEDCTSSFVDEQTWNDTFNAQGCWAAAGCSGFDASTGSFDYDGN